MTAVVLLFANAVGAAIVGGFKRSGVPVFAHDSRYAARLTESLAEHFVNVLPGVAKLILVLALALVAVGGAQAQQHAPTVEVCRADAAVWYSTEIVVAYNTAETVHVTDNVPNRSEVSKLSLKEVNARTREMVACISVDAERASRYDTAQTFYHSVLGDRYIQFVWRHHLKAQLDREDAQGIR